MADLEKTLEVLGKFHLQELGEDWVKSIWDCDFTEIDTTDIIASTELQDNGFHVNTLKLLQQVLDDWVSNKEGQEGEGFWTVLVENDLSHKHLIAFLAFIVDNGTKKSATSTEKESAILSGSNYFKLLTVPGSAAFKIFHPVLYEKCVDILKMWSNFGTSKRKRSISPSQSQSKRKRSTSPSQSQRGRKRTSRNKTRQDPTLNVQDFGGSEDEDDSIEELAPQEINSVKRMLRSLLQDLVTMLDTVSLRQSEASSDHTVQVLTKVTRHETEDFNGDFDKQNLPLTRMPLPELAYKGLAYLCRPLHGNVGFVVHSTFKNLLPSLLMFIGDNKGVAANAIPRPLLLARDHAVRFVCYLLKTCGDRAQASVRTLLQHMCTKVPDRAEYRAKVAQAVITILKELPALAYGKMVEWIFKLSKHSKINNRAFAVDVVSSLLSIPEKQIDGNMEDDLVLYTKHQSLLGILLARCSDIAPTVRSRAISAFSQCFLSSEVGIKDTLKEIVTPRCGPRPAGHPRLIPTPDLQNRAQQVISNDSREVDKTADNGEAPEGTDETPARGLPVLGAQTPFLQIALTPFNPDMTDDDGVLSMFRRRAKDEKVNVRKSALQAIEHVIRFEVPDYRRQDLEVLVDRCRDPALSVRKQAMQCLTDLMLEFPTEIPLQGSWLNGVLPLVIDRETTLQEKCMETLEDIILHNIVQANRSVSDSYKLAWDLLKIISKFESVDLRRFLQKTCRHWARQGKIKPGLITALETHINTDKNEEAWMLLAELAPAAPKFNHNFVLEYWDKQANNTDESHYGTLQRVLTVIRCMAKHIQVDKRTSLIDALKERLKKFDSPPELIAVTISTLSKLCEAQAADSGKKVDKESWCVDLLHACDKYLSHVILDEKGGIEDEDMVVRHLFTLGEIAQLCPAKTPKRVFLIVQSMIAAPCITSAPSSQGNDSWGSDHSHHSTGSMPSTQSADLPSTQTTVAHASTRSTLGNPSQKFSQFQATQVFSQFQGSSRMSSKIRAFAFITLGKLCLQNEDLAKKCVAALARELETSQDQTIRNNVVIIMCDLCVRYTTTADRYVSNIAACLKDESQLVRKQTLTLITRLLQEDFLKWKGTLFFRFITTLLDENKEIRDFSEFCLVHLLFQRHPGMFFHHFMECIFHFNAYESHAVYNKFPQSEREKRLFTLKGKENLSKRLKLYLFMLEHMTDEHRFHLTAKICQDILGGIVDGVIPLNAESSALLQDSLQILSSKEIKLSSLRVKQNEDAVSDEQEMAAVVIAVAKKNIITQVVKKNVIENIVPIVVSLKHMLEKHRSPVLKDLMYYLRELMKDYKTEVKDILAADRQLASEIEFDLRKFEEQQEEAERKKNAAPSIQNSPAAQSARSSPAPQSARSSPVVGSAPGTPVAFGPQKKPSSPAAGNKDTPTHGSPSPRVSPDVRSPGSVGSPRSATENQGTTSPKPTAPIKSILNVHRGTPNREASLSTLALLNSAKKAFEKAQQYNKNKTDSPSARKPEDKRRKSYLARTENTDIHDEEEESSPASGVRFAVEENEVSSTPPRRNTRSQRAISTPSAALNDDGVLGNITFHMDQNVTLIPPSPIPTSMPIRVYEDTGDDSGTPLTPKKNVAGPEDKEMVYMFSPDKPLPKPRKWNVKSAPPPQKTKPTGDSDDEDSEFLSLSDANNDSKNNPCATRNKKSDENTEVQATRKSNRRSGRLKKT